MLAYLRVVANPADEVSLTRIVNVPTRGLGDAAIKQMPDFARRATACRCGSAGAGGQRPGVSRRGPSNRPGSSSQLVASRGGDRTPPRRLSGVRHGIMEAGRSRRAAMRSCSKKAGGDEQDELANVERIDHLRRRVRPGESRRLAGRISGDHQPGQRHRSPEGRRRRGHADDAARRQGVGISGRGDDRPGRGHSAARRARGKTPCSWKKSAGSVSSASPAPRSG